MPRTQATSITAKEFLALKSCPSASLITCTQPIRSKRLIEKIIQTFGSKGAKSQVIKTSGLQLNSQKLAELHDDILTISLFPEPRFFIINDADELSDAAIKVLVKTMSELPASTYLIFCAKSLPASNPITKHCKDSETFVSLEKLEGADLVKWAVRELNDAGIKKFPETLIPSIIEYAQGAPEEISKAIEHLALYVEGEKATNRDLLALFPQAPDASEFELVDSCSDLNPSKPELLFSRLVKHDKSPFMLLAIISRVFSNLRAIRHLLSKGHSETQARQLLNMPPWVFGKNLSASKRYKTSSLELHSHAIIKADSKLKNRSLGPEAIFSELFSGLRP